MPKRTTIEDVAKHAGVSKVTVSYVLNGRHRDARIATDTVERVLESARFLHYRPNALARMLLSRRTDSIGVVFQFADYFSSASNFTAEVMRGVCGACVSHGLDLLLHTKPVDSGEDEADALMDGRVDGLLMLRDADDPALIQVQERDFPVVLFFTRPGNGSTPFVDADNYSGGRLATRHLIEQGHKRIAVLRGSAQSVSSNDRFNGYRDAMESAGLPIRPDHICTLESPNASPDCLFQMMQKPDRPTALFVWSDDVAFAVLRWLSDIGLSVPDDVSVVGYDSSVACDRSYPPLTSIRQPIFDMAYEATDMLARIIRRAPLERTQQLFPPTLDIRASTAPPNEP